MDALQIKSITNSLKDIFLALGLDPDVPVGFNSAGELVQVVGVAIDGVTASAAEINLLDGCTATTDELNILAGTDAVTADLDKLAALGVVVPSAAAAETHLADASIAHALNATFDDTEVEAALNALGVKINHLIDSLEAFGINAAS